MARGAWVVVDGGLVVLVGGILARDVLVDVEVVVCGHHVWVCRV